LAPGSLEYAYQRVGEHDLRFMIEPIPGVPYNPVPGEHSYCLNPCDGDDLAESSLTTLPLGRLIFSVAKKVP